MHHQLMSIEKLGYGCRAKEGEDVVFHYRISDSNDLVLSRSCAENPRIMRLDRRK